MDVDTTRLREVAERIRRQTTNRDILDLCDGVLALSVKRSCPACEARKAAKAASQRKWRNAKAKG